MLNISAQWYTDVKLSLSRLNGLMAMAGIYMAGGGEGIAGRWRDGGEGG